MSAKLTRVKIQIVIINDFFNYSGFIAAVAFGDKQNNIGQVSSGLFLHTYLGVTNSYILFEEILKFYLKRV